MIDHDFLNRFTTHLKETLQKALGFTLRQQRFLVEPGDLLVGLLHEKGCIGSELLLRARISPDQAEAFFAGTPDHHHAGEPVAPDLSNAVKQLLEQAVMAAHQHEHRYIGTEHLLFAFTEKPSAELKQFFQEQHLSLDLLREQVKQILQSTAKFPDLSQKAGESEGEGEEDTEGEPATAGSPERLRPAKEKRPSALDVFARHLTHPETVTKLDPVVGRDAEIERVIEILCRRTKNNPILLGEPGVGKTAIAEGLAQRLATGDVPDTLQGKRLYAIDLALMVAGTMYRGEFEARLKQLVEEVRSDPRLILFIDEIHTIVGAGSTSGSLDAANILKPALARGEIRCIGATTWAEFKKHIEPDAALERRYQPVDVSEPTAAATLTMLQGLKPRYETHHGVKFETETLPMAVQLAERYLTDRFFPDKAIDILDEAAAHVTAQYRSTDLSKKLRAVDKSLHDIQQRRTKALDANDLKAAAAVVKEEERFTQERKALENALLKRRQNAKLTVTTDDIASVVARLSRVPVETILATEQTQLLKLEDRFNAVLFGQTNATQAVADVIRRSRLGFHDQRRPKGSWLFVGPSGTGKTELARQIALELFGKEEALIKFDMSEFAEGHSVSKLLGSPAGYVGYREQSRLADTIRKRPHAVILFDEFEKAHPDVQHLLLQILEDGRVQDSTGKQVSFRQAFVVLTSNAGSDLLNRHAIGFDGGQNASTRTEALVHEHLRERFRPELLNRLDRIVVFHPLEKAARREIVARELQELLGRLKTQRHIQSTVEKPVIDWLLARPWKQEEGARALRRLIEQELQQPLITALLTNPKKKRVKISVAKEALQVR